MNGIRVAFVYIFVAQPLISHGVDLYKPDAVDLFVIIGVVMAIETGDHPTLRICVTGFPEYLQNLFGIGYSAIDGLMGKYYGRRFSFTEVSP